MADQFRYFFVNGHEMLIAEDVHKKIEKNILEGTAQKFQMTEFYWINLNNVCFVTRVKATPKKETKETEHVNGERIETAPEPTGETKPADTTSGA